MNVQIIIDGVEYVANNNIKEMLQELKEAQHDMRLMSEELERNEETIKNLELEKLEVESQLAHTHAHLEAHIFELEEALGQIQDLANNVL